MTEPCTVTGVLRDAAGDLLTSTKLSFQRQALLQAIEGETIVSPVFGAALAAAETVTTDGTTAAFSIDLMPGVYRLSYQGGAGIEAISFAVPVAETRDLAILIGQATNIDSTLIQTVLGYKTDAEAARDKAQEWAEGTLPGGAGTKSAAEHAADAGVSAGAAAGSAGAAAGSETNAGNYAADAASSAVAAGQAAYPTPADGIAATTNGQYFGVAQSHGIGTDVWLNSGGEAVYHQTVKRGLLGEDVAQIDLAISSPYLAPQMPTGAVFDLLPMDAQFHNRRVVPNRGQTPNRNLHTWRTGKLGGTVASGAVQTERYADGPTGTLTATRVQFADTNDIWYLFNTARPAGDYTIRLKVKSVLGAGTQDIRHGVFNTDMATVSINEADWTTLEYSFTSTGSAPTNYALHTNTAGSYPVDVLVDEVQVYQQGDTIPDFEDEATGVGTLQVPLWSVPGSIGMSGNVLTPAVNGIIPMTVDFTPVSPTEGTLFALIRETGASSAFASVVLPPTQDSTTYYRLGIGTEGGWLSLRGPNGAAAANLPNTAQRIKIQGEGWQIVGVRFDAAKTERFFHEVKIDTITAGLSTLAMRWMIAGGAGNAGSGAFNGDIGGLVWYDRALTDAEVETVVASLRARLSLMGQGNPGFSTLLLSEGDSISATTTPTCFTWRQRDLWSPTMKVVVHATSGATLTTLEGRLSAALEVIRKGRLGGRTVVATVLVGANDGAQLTAANRAAYMTRLTAYWDALRDAGAKVVACTILPRTDATFTADRNAVNALIRAASLHYDGLADFAADATMGGDSAASNLTYYSDGVHPTDAGQAILATIASAALVGLVASDMAIL